MIRIVVDGLSIQEIHRKYKSTIKHGLEVLRYTAMGLSEADAARLLCLAHGSVHSRLKAFYAVIGARNRAHAVAICAAQGWLTAADLDKALDTRKFRNVG